MPSLFVPNRVEEVLIVVPNSLYDKVVADISTSGIFHIEQPTKELNRYSTKTYRSASGIASERKARLEGYFKILDTEPQLIEGIDLTISDWLEFLNQTINQNANLETEFEKESTKINDLKNRLVDLNELKNLLSAVSYIDKDIRSPYQAKNISFIIGTIPKEVIESVKKISSDLNIIISIDEIEGEKDIIGLAGMPENVKKALNEINRLGFTPIAIRTEFSGIPSIAIKEINDEINNINDEINQIKQKLNLKINDLKIYYTKIYVLNEVFKILNNTASTETASFVHGFVDAKESKQLKTILNNSTQGAYMLYSLGIKRGEKEIPTKMDIPKAFKPFESILKMYGTPNSDEIIPTIFMAITMPIIFGLMFPDIGHGLLVLLFALFYLMPRSKDIGKVIAILGIAGMITGFLASEFFGPIPAEFLHLDLLWHSIGLKAAPLESPVDVSITGGSSSLMSSLFAEAMDISFWVGAFMLIFGTLLGIINSYLKKDYEDMIGEKVPMFLLFTSATSPFLIYFNVYKAGTIIKTAIFGVGRGGPFEAFVFYGAIIALIWILFGKGIVRAAMGEGFKLNPMESFIGMFEAMLLALGNTISFLRILGLSLAHSGLMVGFTILALVIDPVGLRNPLMFIGAVIIYILGNLLTAGLEGIVAFAHDLRLHFYEWFNKFYTGHGVSFQPIKLPKVNITFH